VSEGRRLGRVNTRERGAWLGQADVCYLDLDQVRNLTLVNPGLVYFHRDRKLSMERKVKSHKATWPLACVTAVRYLHSLMI